MNPDNQSNGGNAPENNNGNMSDNNGQNNAPQGAPVMNDQNNNGWNNGNTNNGGMNGNMSNGGDMNNMNGGNMNNGGNFNGNMNGNFNNGMNGNMNNMNGNFNNGMNGNFNGNMNMSGMQQAPKPPKKPMDPKTKKTIIIASACGGGALVLGIAAAIILPIVLRVDYSEAYKISQDLKKDINEIVYDYSCDRVVSYASSTYVSNKDYKNYVTECKTLGESATEKVQKLGETAGIKRNTDLQNQYNTFRSEFDKLVARSDDRDKILEKFETWHEFAVAAGDLTSADESDADLTAAANVLIKSNDSTFKSYGEGWLERRKKMASAYREYRNASWNESSDKYKVYSSLKSEYDDYVKKNKPAVADFGTVNGDNVKAMSTAWTKLKDMISETYARNYNSGSGDCWEFAGEVVCE